MIDETNPSVTGVDDLESRMEAYLDSKDEQPEELPPEDEPEELPPEDEPEELPPEDEPEEFEDLVWNGQTKRVTKTELRELAQKGFDYTQKTQELAEQRRTIEAERQALKFHQEFQQANVQAITDLRALDLAIEAASQKDWNQLKSTDPAAFMTEMMQLQNMRQQRQEVANWINNQQQQALQQQQAKKLEQRQQALQRVRQKIPDYTDEVDRALDEYVRKQGFEPWEIEQFFDDRSAIMAYKAWKYDQLQAKKPALEKKVSAAPKPIKPGSKTPGRQQTQQLTDLRKRVKQTGDMNAAAVWLAKQL
jgi:vacuolar-type H+-ATPase subunit I/STV1